MQNFLVWLQGKKTYIVAGLAVVATAVLLWFGYASPEQAVTLLTIAAGLAGLSAKLNRWLPQIATAAAGVAKAGADYRAGDKKAALTDIEQAAVEVAEGK